MNLWINAIRNSRLEIDEALENKSLKNKIDKDSLEVIYIHAKKDAAAEIHQSVDIFPEFIPEEFSIELVIDSVYIEKYLVDYARSIDAKKELGLL